jgi:hypothetical protein
MSMLKAEGRWQAVTAHMQQQQQQQTQQQGRLGQLVSHHSSVQQCCHTTGHTIWFLQRVPL